MGPQLGDLNHGSARLDIINAHDITSFAGIPWDELGQEKRFP